MTTRWLLTTAALLTAIALIGCPAGQRQPELRGARVTPSQLRPGDNALITVEVVDPMKTVERVAVSLDEAGDYTVDMRDDGLEGDVRAGDGIWSFWVEVPFGAPPGEYEFTLTAYSDRGNVVLVNDPDGNAVPLTASFACTILAPDLDSAAND